MTRNVVLSALLLCGCGAPDVDVPSGNDNSTSDEKAPQPLAAPLVDDVPAKYPYPRLALRGSAGPGAVRIVVEGAGNPTLGNVQPVDGKFCVNVDLAVSPAKYTLEVYSQSGDGKLSNKAKVVIDRSNDAEPPKEAKLCDGTPAAPD